MCKQALLDYVLSLADTQLVLGHRLSEWAGHGPLLEEDIALSNLGLDLLGQARALYTYAGEVEGKGNDEDQLAFFRDANEFRNLLLVEQPNGDFAATIVRHVFFSCFFYRYWHAMTQSSDSTLAAIAAKSVKEMAYHRRHSVQWLIRLGDGTDESHQRAQQAVNNLYRYTDELFQHADTDKELIEAEVAIDVCLLRNDWLDELSALISEATLTLPADEWMQQGGRQGLHTEHLGYLLAEMQHVQRTHPGAEW